MLILTKFPMYLTHRMSMKMTKRVMPTMKGLVALTRANVLSREGRQTSQVQGHQAQS